MSPKPCPAVRTYRRGRGGGVAGTPAGRRSRRGANCALAGVAPLERILADIGKEDRGRHGLKCVAVEPALEPRVKPVAPDIGLDRTQERCALFISDIAQHVVGITPGDVEMEARIGTGGPAI